MMLGGEEKPLVVRTPVADVVKPGSGPGPASSARPLVLPAAFARRFAALRHTAIDAFAPVRKHNDAGRLQDRVVVVAGGVVFLCTPGGEVRRSFPLEWVREVYCDVASGLVALVVPQLYDLAVFVPAASRVASAAPVGGATPLSPARAARALQPPAPKAPRGLFSCLAPWGGGGQERDGGGATSPHRAVDENRGGAVVTSADAICAAAAAAGGGSGSNSGGTGSPAGRAGSTAAISAVRLEEGEEGEEGELTPVPALAVSLRAAYNRLPDITAPLRITTPSSYPPGAAPSFALKKPLGIVLPDAACCIEYPPVHLPRRSALTRRSVFNLAAAAAAQQEGLGASSTLLGGAARGGPRDDDSTGSGSGSGQSEVLEATVVDETRGAAFGPPDNALAAGSGDSSARARGRNASIVAGDAEVAAAPLRARARARIRAGTTTSATTRRAAAPALEAVVERHEDAIAELRRLMEQRQQRENEGWQGQPVLLSPCASAPSAATPPRQRVAAIGGAAVGVSPTWSPIHTSTLPRPPTATTTTATTTAATTMDTSGGGSQRRPLVNIEWRTGAAPPPEVVSATAERSRTDAVPTADASTQSSFAALDVGDAQAAGLWRSDAQAAALAEENSCLRLRLAEVERENEWLRSRFLRRQD